MDDNSNNKSSVSSFFYMRPRRQLAVSVFLMTVIPVLASFHLGSLWSGGFNGFSFSFLTVMIMTILSATGGYLVIKKFPSSIEQLRRYVAQLTSGDYPDQITLQKTSESDDLRYIEKGFNTVLLELIKTEHQRTMLSSLATLCGYIQKPASSLTQYIQALAGQAESRFDHELLDECMRDAEYINKAIEMIYSSKEFKEADFNPADCKMHDNFFHLADLVVSAPFEDCEQNQHCFFREIRSLPLKERLHALHNMPIEEADAAIKFHARCSEKTRPNLRKSA
jgi:hypothetical protein